MFFPSVLFFLLFDNVQIKVIILHWLQEQASLLKFHKMKKAERFGIKSKKKDTAI